MIHAFLANYYKTNRQANEQPSQQISEKKEWYETFWGLVILSIGLDVFSAFLYERGKSALGISNRKERRRERLRLIREGRTPEQAAIEETAENEELNREEAEDLPL